MYPDTEDDMRRKHKSDDDIKDILSKAQLTEIWEREPAGLDSFNDWNDVLSGGEKQRIAMARLFYHAPMYAIVDECTSAVSLDVESLLYEHSKKLEITLVTISHRHTLYKYHDYLLQFSGEGTWNISKIEPEYRGGEQASL